MVVPGGVATGENCGTRQKPTSDLKRFEWPEKDWGRDGHSLRAASCGCRRGRTISSSVPREEHRQSALGADYSRSVAVHLGRGSRLEKAPR